jgi:hypothetical protein
MRKCFVSNGVVAVIMKPLGKLVIAEGLWCRGRNSTTFGRGLWMLHGFCLAV